MAGVFCLRRPLFRLTEECLVAFVMAVEGREKVCDFLLELVWFSCLWWA